MNNLFSTFALMDGLRLETDNLQIISYIHKESKPCFTDYLSQIRDVSKLGE